MLSTFVVLGYVAALTIPTLCCRPKEYTTRDGQCCPKCHEGTVVRKDCTLQSGTGCSPCDNGTYMNLPNGLSKCFLCTSCDRGHGLFAQKNCTAKRDTHCGVLSGYFCTSWADDAGCSLAEKHTRCDPGQRIKEPGTSRTDTACEPCKPGYFSKDGVNCTAWTNCPDTQVKLEGSTSSDVVCGSASRNHYCSVFVLMLLLLTVVALVITARLTSKKIIRPKSPVQEVND
ncbi:tumor necrosis factor receptor superfamily member 5-like [Pagrus major]|uniref:tumor necrosis factor receptor superfamily member 5-like n=1 Tax=Pagrus major TaxID=143350 RepID=UPI003CC8A8CB